MRLAIMQPYFLPYIGYFQLIAAVDRFIVYDRIKYTKKGWINRNRMLRDGKDVTFSLPLKAGSDSLDVVERELATDFNRDKLLNQFRGAYARAPQFEPTYALLERIVRCPDANLFGYIHHSLAAVCEHLRLRTPLQASSTVDFDNSLKGQDKVLAICKATCATQYLNAFGGTELYQREAFAAQGIELHFLQPQPCEYPQFGAGFVPSLSIVDVLMFNSTAQVCSLLTDRVALS
jgi:hypothetical protein